MRLDMHSRGANENVALMACLRSISGVLGYQDVPSTGVYPQVVINSPFSVSSPCSLQWMRMSTKSDIFHSRPAITDPLYRQLRGLGFHTLLP